LRWIYFSQFRARDAAMQKLIAAKTVWIKYRFWKFKNAIRAVLLHKMAHFVVKNAGVIFLLMELFRPLHLKKIPCWQN
jgi:hypothetical protein